MGHPPVRLILVTGGARSGKSDYAERRALELGAEAVTYVATAAPGDDEMARRIARHRDGRPRGWRTVEAPRDAGAAVCAAATDVVLLDCLTLLASNALLSVAGRDGGEGAEDAAQAAVVSEVDALCAAAAGRSGTLLVVTNEVGLGVVPPTPLGRWFRDALGAANRRLAAAADEVVLLVSGVPVHVKGRAPLPAPTGGSFGGRPAGTDEPLARETAAERGGSMEG